MGAVLSSRLIGLFTKLKCHIKSSWKSNCCKNSSCGCISDVAINETDNKFSPPKI